MEHCFNCGLPLNQLFIHVEGGKMFCSESCLDSTLFKNSGGVAPTPPTPSQVKDELSKTMVELSIKLAAGNLAAKEREQALKQVESLRASVRILEKQKLVLNHENSRLYNKVRDLDGLCAEQIEYIEELERKVIQEDDNPSYIAQLHKILDEKDKKIKEYQDYLNKCRQEYRVVLEKKNKEIEELREEVARFREGAPSAKWRP